VTFSLRILTITLAVGLSACAAAPRSGASSDASFQLGTVTSGSAPTGCPKPGYTCSGLVITCPGVRETAHAYIATAEPTTSLRGAVALFSPGAGDETWTRDFRPAKDFVKQIRADGLRVLQVWWENPWLASSSGERIGAAKLACRPATVIRWLHDHNAVPSATSSRPCGFCVSGGSAGASEIAYALTRYGVESRVDLAALASGPPHADIAIGCDGSEPAALGSGAARRIMDMSYGFLSGGGPCETKDQSWIPRWDADSVDASGDFYYAHTAVRFIFSNTDPVAIYKGQRYADKLDQSRSPDVEVAVVDGMPHNVQNSEAGLAILRIALTGKGTFPASASSASPSHSPTPQPSPSRNTGRKKTPRATTTPSRHLGEGARDEGGSGPWLVIAVVAACAAAGGTYFIRRRAAQR